jgi:hypothetical protein
MFHVKPKTSLRVFRDELPRKVIYNAQRFFRSFGSCHAGDSFRELFAIDSELPRRISHMYREVCGTRSAFAAMFAIVRNWVWCDRS